MLALDVNEGDYSSSTQTIWEKGKVFFPPNSFICKKARHLDNPHYHHSIILWSSLDCSLAAVTYFGPGNFFVQANLIPVIIFSVGCCET